MDSRLQALGMIPFIEVRHLLDPLWAARGYAADAIQLINSQDPVRRYKIYQAIAVVASAMTALILYYFNGLIDAMVRITYRWTLRSVL